MKTTIHQMRTTLDRHTVELALGAARHPALAYDGPRDVLVALGARSGAPLTQKNAIVSALLSEVQTSRHSLWTTLLVVAFEPALLSLRDRVGEQIEDADLVIIGALIEAAWTVSPHAASAIMSLHRAMVRRVLEQVPKPEDRPEELLLDPRAAEIPWPGDQLSFVHCAAREIVRACAAIPGASEMALASLGGISAKDATKAEPMPPSERRRIQRQFHARNHRALQQVRKGLR